MSAFTSISIYTLLLFLLYKFVIAPAVVSPLSKLPNAHFTVPILPVWIWWIKRQSFLNRATLALHQKHGPIVRIGPNEISVNSAEGLRTIYVTGGFEKTKWYRDIFENFNVPNLVSMQNKTAHSSQKRLISHIYSKTYIQNSPNLLKISNEIIYNRLLPALDEAANSDTPLDVLSLSKAAGMDFTSAYLFGLANGTDFIRDKASLELWFQKYDIFKVQAPEERAFGDIEQWCLDLCMASELFDGSTSGSGSGSGAVLGSKDNGTPPIVHQSLWTPLQQQYVSRTEQNRLIVASEMLDHLVAGHETTGVTMTYLMYELSRHPSLMTRLREELAKLKPSVGAGSATLPPSSAVDALPLLDAIVRETLRVYAAASSPQPRITPQFKSTLIEGYDIPGGVTVSSSAYTLHRNPEVYPEPQNWEPSRWLKADKAHLDEMKRWFWPFGSGGRMCLGSHFAIQELKLITAAIYTNFSTFVVDDEGIEQADSFVASPISNKLILGFKHVK